MQFVLQVLLAYVSPISLFVASKVPVNAKYSTRKWDSNLFRFLRHAANLSHIDVDVLVIVFAEADRVEVDGDLLLLLRVLSPVGAPADVVLAELRPRPAPAAAGAPPRAKGGPRAAEPPRDVGQVGERGDKEHAYEHRLPGVDLVGEGADAEEEGEEEEEAGVDAQLSVGPAPQRRLVPLRLRRRRHYLDAQPLPEALLREQVPAVAARLRRRVSATSRLEKAFIRPSFRPSARLSIHVRLESYLIKTRGHLAESGCLPPAPVHAVPVFPGEGGGCTSMSSSESLSKNLWWLIPRRGREPSDLQQ